MGSGVAAAITACFSSTGVAVAVGAGVGSAVGAGVTSKAGAAPLHPSSRHMHMVVISKALFFRMAPL